MRAQTTTKAAQRCRTCGAPLSDEYLKRLAKDPGRWLPCPGHFCPEYWRESEGRYEQQRAVVLRRQGLI